MRFLFLVAVALLALLPAATRPALAQARCPQAAGPDAEAGWAAYRAGDMPGARARFAAALVLCPGDPYAATGLGYVALREGVADEARRAFTQVVAARPDDVDALVGLGIVAWREGDVEGAEGRFRRVLALEPGNATALDFMPRIRAALDASAARPEASLAAPSVEGNLGAGRALTWGGRLAEGEAALRRARAADPSDVGVLVVLAQNLRWQGRNVAALEVLDEAARLAPENGDVREQRAWVDAALSPQLRSAVTTEWDSEDNRMRSGVLVASLRPVRRVVVRADTYRRSLRLGSLDRWAQGLTVSAAWEAEPGWGFAAGVGGSHSNGTGEDSFAAWTLSMATPRRYAVSGAFTASSAALDVTAPLAERGVRVTEAAAAGQWSPAAGWRLEGTASLASYEGSGSNRRTSASASAFRRVGRVWTLGGGVRAFGFRDDLSDGYFDPDFYGIAEVSLRWMYEPGRWSFVADVAPALQQVTRAGDPTGAMRASARVSYRVAPGREITLSGGVSSTGLQSFATGASGYRYRALGAGAVWVF